MNRRLRPTTLVIGVAWVLFLASFFAPASTHESGWEMFVASTGVFAFPLLIIADPRLLLLLAFPFLNLLMLFAPAVVYLLGDGKILVMPLLTGGVLPYLLPRELLPDLLVGFYLWNGSYFLMAAGCLLRLPEDAWI